jgi:hypothetical protein
VRVQINRGSRPCGYIGRYDQDRRIELQKSNPQEACQNGSLDPYPVGWRFQSALASSRRLSEEIPALAAVMPASPPIAIKTAFSLRPLPDAVPVPGNTDLIKSNGSSLLPKRLMARLPYWRPREAFLIARTSSSFVICDRPSIPMLAASSTSSCLF